MTLTRRILLWLAVLLGAWWLIAYFALPALWTHYEHQKKLEGLPMVTTTAQDIPGDPINIGIVGASGDLICAMNAAGWRPADPVTWRSSLEIAGSVLLDRPYPTAPVSNLYYDGRRQDLAFEQPVGQSADQRHHVRLWLVLMDGDDGRPLWFGAATFDRSVGLSRTTGEITHHIAPDVDRERQLIATDLQTAGMLAARYQVTGIGPALRGRNGGGDAYFTDGEVWVLRLVEACARRTAPPVVLPSPAATAFKDAIWRSVADAYRGRSR